MGETEKEKKVHLVPVTPQDKEQLYLWRNDPLTRSASTEEHEISWEEHEKWFQRVWDHPDHRLYLAKWGEETIGQIRIFIEKERGTISYSLAEEYRGRGMGKELLFALEDLVKKESLVEWLQGSVKDGNIPSLRSFEGAGYQGRRDGEMILFTKAL